MKPFPKVSTGVIWLLIAGSIAIFIFFVRSTGIPPFIQPLPVLLQCLAIWLIALTLKASTLPRMGRWRLMVVLALATAVISLFIMLPATVFGMLVPT